MYLLTNQPRASERADYQRRLVVHRKFEIVRQPLVAPVHDQVDGPRRNPSGIILFCGSQFPGDALQPFFQRFQWPGIE